MGMKIILNKWDRVGIEATYSKLAPLPSLPHDKIFIDTFLLLFLTLYGL